MVYIDLYFIKTTSDFCSRVMKGVAQAYEELPFLRKALQFASRLRPTLSIDPSGATTISVDSRAASEPDSVAAVMEALAKLASEGRTCVVFDEFQDILKLENASRVLAEMRRSIQFQEQVAYFFTGSVRNEMAHIFADLDSPFYKSALPFLVDEIDPKEFTKFIKKRFEVGERTISSKTIEQILAFADGVPGDVQEFCEALWTTTEAAEEITPTCFRAALELIFSREIRGYEATMEHLTPAQASVLRALAENGHALLTSTSFTDRLSLAPSTVKRVVNRLLADHVIFLRRGEYCFSNPFFKAWLQVNTP